MQVPVDGTNACGCGDAIADNLITLMSCCVLSSVKLVSSVQCKHSSNIFNPALQVGRFGVGWWDRARSRRICTAIQRSGALLTYFAEHQRRRWHATMWTSLTTSHLLRPRRLEELGESLSGDNDRLVLILYLIPCTDLQQQPQLKQAVADVHEVVKSIILITLAIILTGPGWW